MSVALYFTKTSKQPIMMRLVKEDKWTPVVPPVWR